MADFSYLSKITIAKIGLKPVEIKILVESQKEACPVARVLGRTSGFQVVSGELGESNRFDGEFEAINILSGDVFRSKNLFLPQLASDLLEGILQGANDKEAQKFEVDAQSKKGPVKQMKVKFEKNIEFAIDLVAIPSKSQTGYEWNAQPVIEVKTEDPFKVLKAGIKKAFPSYSKKK